MTATKPFREISDAEFLRASEQIEQFQRFLTVALEDDEVEALLPRGSELRFRGVTVNGKPFQLAAFRPEAESHAKWRSRITLGDLDWAAARRLDDDSDVFEAFEDAFDDLELRLRTALAPVFAWEPA